MKISKELLRGSTIILILRSLEGRPMYSHEMIREIEDESGEVFRLNQGTLYPMLHALESEGPRTASVPGTEADGGSRRPGGAADAANRPRLEWGPLLLAGSLLGVGLFTLHTVESHGSATGGSSRPSLPRRQDKFDSESLYPRCPGRTLHRPPHGPSEGNRSASAATPTLPRRAASSPRPAAGPPASSPGGVRPPGIPVAARPPGVRWADPSPSNP